MAESLEHLYLKMLFLKVLKGLSKTKMYGFTEIERGKYDIACVLGNCWERVLIGQIAWSNKGSLDKDIRQLTDSNDSEIWVLVVKDTLRNRRDFETIVHSFKQSNKPMHKLKAFWIPPTFNVKKMADRIEIEKELKAEIVNDILFNIVFGGLTQHEFGFFYSSLKGKVGYHFEILSYINQKRFTTWGSISRDLNISIPAVKERIIPWQALGLLTEEGNLSLKCKTLLNVFSRFLKEYQSKFSVEFLYILSKLGFNPIVTTKNLTLTLIYLELYPIIRSPQIMKNLDGLVNNVLPPQLHLPKNAAKDQDHFTCF